MFNAGNWLNQDWSVMVPKPGSVANTPVPLPSPPAPKPTTTTTTTTTSAAQKAALDQHNKQRSKHGVPALAWDAKLAASAQAWADKCPNGHSGTSGVGENMAWGYANFPAAIDAWYNEVSGLDVATCVNLCQTTGTEQATVPLCVVYISLLGTDSTLAWCICNSHIRTSFWS